MRKIIDELDTIEKRVMSGLKDFQRATVERIDELYRPPHNQKRVLVSDEVGLGKTLVARGVVAKFANLRKEEGDDLVKVVYICSNGAIAEQNLNKLKIDKGLQTESTSSSRLSMQHLNIFDQEHDDAVKGRYIQLIPLTPETSFRMTNGAGTVNERALMYAILRRIPDLADYRRQLVKFMREDAVVSWKSWVRDYYEREVVRCNKETGGKYLDYMLDKVGKELSELQENGQSLKDMLIGYFDAVSNREEPSESRSRLIGKLRTVFAKVSMEKLEPDIVIMDEFQRFRFLLDADPESETGMLVHKFFHANDVRMLLLSATPFKMYSTMEEIDQSQVDEHYSEFLGVMDFLNEDSEKNAEFRTVWSNYSEKLKEVTVGETSILQAKKDAEEAMYGAICRTERVSAETIADIIDDHEVRKPVDVLDQDIKSYVQMQELLTQINAGFSVPVDYVKSSPYLMSFMRDYKLKQHVEKYFREHPDEINKADKDTFWIKYKTINRYDKLSGNNARVESVMSSTLKKGAEKLLWVPPSKPYYELEGAFRQFPDFSKTLIFSAWEMVPRMIASLFSYEAERLTVGIMAKAQRDKDARYFQTGEKRYPRPRLNFRLKDGVPRAMTLFCLLYPSDYLARLYEPIDCMNRRLGIRDIEREIRAKIKDDLQKFRSVDFGKPDRRWYYIFPMLMDKTEYVHDWFDKCNELQNIDEENATRKSRKGFVTHLQQMQSWYEETIECNCSNLGKQPDDLVEVLTDMVLASPAVCMYRTYLMYDQDRDGVDSLLPTKIARVFINRMNSPEATAAVELTCGRRSEDAHWMNVLKYGKQGNLQAVFDEYVHLIASGFDGTDGIIEKINDEILRGMDIKTTVYSIDTFGNFKARATGEGNPWKANMRTHYAVAFTKGEGRESDNERKKTVRNAFNSPFRPFILASTSIGQEGLDFHNYCRRIVHWNLPANPIDLEQREGRINRFKCLAIRQNVANRYGGIQFEKNVWDELFAEAEQREKEKAGGESDLIPFWGLTEEPGMIKIERIVPMYPFSRDELSYERLIKILSLYRLTLGQARQEELLEYIFENYTKEDEKELKKLFINLSPYYKKQQQGKEV